MWQFQIHDTVTGRLVDRVNPASGSWTRRMSGKGSGSHVFKLLDADYDQATWRDLLEPWKRTLVVLWVDESGGRAPLYAGVITKSQYDYATKAVTVSHECVRTLFMARLTFANGNYSNGGLWIEGKSASGALRAILQRATGNTGRSLPIDYAFIPDGTGDINLGWAAPQLAYIDDCLTELERLGYDIDFVPQFMDDHLFSWAPTIGKPLRGPMSEHTLTAVEAPFTGVSVTIDALKAATSVFVVGNGSGEDMKVGWAPAGIPAESPALERKDQAKRQQSSLGSIATARLGERSWATVQWSFSVDLDRRDSITGLRETPVTFVPTNLVRIHTAGDPWLTDQYRDLRVVALAGDMTHRVKPEVQ